VEAVAFSVLEAGWPRTRPYDFSPSPSPPVTCSRDLDDYMYMYVRITTPQRSLNGVDTAERADIHGVPPMSRRPLVNI